MRTFSKSDKTEPKAPLLKKKKKMGQSKENIKKLNVPVIKRLDPDSTLRLKSSTNTLPVGVTT